MVAVDESRIFPDTTLNDQTLPLDPHLHLVALDRFFGGAMALGLTF